MSIDTHREAERLAGLADASVHEGNQADAERFYQEAAEREYQAYHAIPSARARTKAIIAVSATALFRKAKAFADAERAAHVFLSDPDLPDWAKLQLEELLLDVRYELQRRGAGGALGRDVFDISLEGQRIGPGLAPLEDISLKLQQLGKFIERVTVWVAHQPFRPNMSGGLAPQGLITSLMTAPTAGSFRFQLRLASPPTRQASMFEDVPTAPPDAVADAFFGILTDVAHTDKDALENRVPEAQYREVFLKLVRNIAPDGRDVSRLEITRMGVDGIAEPSAVLTAEARRDITQKLLPLPRRVAREDVQVGILRGLHLDQAWIVLLKGQSEQKCFIGQHEVFDDVVGPLVNHRVRVPGYWTGKGKSRKFVLLDIQPGAEDEEMSETP